MLRQPASHEKIVSALQFNYMAHTLTLTFFVTPFLYSLAPVPAFPCKW
jgi:hypothetical protein